MLEVNYLNVAYGQHPALQGVAISIDKGEIVVILGANGAGKSTLLRSVAGICEGEVSGEITLSGRSLLGLSSDDIVASGVSLVPEGRGIFADLTVKENLLLGAYSARARSQEKENLERVINLFPKLGERQNQIARTMSGGEQQMVAIGRAMMSAPDILMLDEPSLGLAPVLCQELFQNLARVKELGIGILLVEQNARQSLAIADRGYLLENTRSTHQDSATNLATDPAVQKAYLGVGATSATASTSDMADEPAPIPASVFSTSTGEIRRNADQQIGSSIEEIVAKAVETSAAETSSMASLNSDSAVPKRTNGAATTPTGLNGKDSANNDTTSVSVSKPVASNDVERVTLDIERAAREARRRALERVKSASRRESPIRKASVENTSGVNGEPKEKNSAPPVIEIYKRPRVEVYRRRPGGEFERD